MHWFPPGAPFTSSSPKTCRLGDVDTVNVPYEWIWMTVLFIRYWCWVDNIVSVCINLFFTILLHVSANCELCTYYACRLHALLDIQIWKFPNNFLFWKKQCHLVQILVKKKSFVFIELLHLNLSIFISVIYFSYIIRILSPIYVEGVCW